MLCIILDVTSNKEITGYFDVLIFFILFQCAVFKEQFKANGVRMNFFFKPVCKKNFRLTAGHLRTQMTGQALPARFAFNFQVNAFTFF